MPTPMSLTVLKLGFPLATTRWATTRLVTARWLSVLGLSALFLGGYGTQASAQSSACPAALAQATPPIDGTVVDVSPGETWQTLAERYGRRADVLFEVNGCAAEVPSRVFVPASLNGNLPSVAAVVNRDASRELRYPLVEEADVVLSYGWQPHSTRDELVFNSGIAFSVVAPNEVVATASGTVAFADNQEGYGNLVVINHAEGLQTRYANLSNISVSVGQSVAAADLVGQVGSGGGATFLYFEVRKNSSEGWVAQDPGKYVPALDLQ